MTDLVSAILKSAFSSNVSPLDALSAEETGDSESKCSLIKPSDVNKASNRADTRRAARGSPYRESLVCRLFTNQCLKMTDYQLKKCSRNL